MNNKKENKMTYTTNDVRFQIHVSFDQDRYQAEYIALEGIWKHTQMLWNKYFADGKPIALHPYVKIEMVHSNDAMAKDCPVAAASDAPRHLPDQPCSLLINLDSCHDELDMFRIMMHEMAHIYDFMTTHVDDREHAKLSIKHQKQMIKYDQDQPMIDSKWEQKTRDEIDQQPFLNSLQRQMIYVKNQLLSHMESKMLYYNSVDSENRMIQILQQKLPDLYDNTESYIHRFHGTFHDFIGSLRDLNKNIRDDGQSIPTITRQKIEKHITPWVMKHIPMELKKHWDYQVHNFLSNNNRGFDISIMGKPYAVKNEGHTEGYTQDDMMTFFDIHRQDYVYFNMMDYVDSKNWAPVMYAYMKVINPKHIK